MITKMTRYSFILLSENTDAFLKKLQGMGVVDITRSKKPVDSVSAAMFERSREISAAVSALKRVDFSKSEDAAAIAGAAEKADVSGDAVTLVKEIRTDIEKTGARYNAALKEAEKRRPWGEFDKSSLERIEKDGYRIRFYSVGKKRYDPEWSELYPVCIIEDNGSTVWFVTVSDDPGYSFPLEEQPALTEDWRAARDEAESLKREMIRQEGRLVKLKDRIAEMQAELKAGAGELDLYLASAARETAADSHITVFEGFAPADIESRLCDEFDKMDIVYLKEAAKEEDNPPIKLKNNRFSRQFEILTGMYGMPVYSEFDPTPVLSVFFLLFFAMCMGDAGYGILLIAIGLMMKKMTGSMARLGPLVTILGGGTFVVGIILGTFFGINLAEASWVPSWLKKVMITGEWAYSTSVWR